MTMIELSAVEKLQDENRRLKKRLEILEKAYEPLYRPKSFLLLGEDAKPVMQVGVEMDSYSDEVVLKNRHGGTNSGRHISELILDCVNAVCRSQWVYTQLMKQEVSK